MKRRRRGKLEKYRGGRRKYEGYNRGIIYKSYI
jgi:hypothetical protein